MTEELSARAKELLAGIISIGAIPAPENAWFDHDRVMAELAWQATLKPSDPRHKAMCEIVDVDGKEWVSIYWGGYEYPYDLDRIEQPEDLLWLLTHIGKKKWAHSTSARIARLIEKIAFRKGWKPFDRVAHPNEAPPAFHDAKAEREKLTPSLRYAVIRRDGSRCRCCGASVSTGAVLHVDHIIPIAKGGVTVEGNLQTLCAVCNQGKAAQ